MGFFDFLKAPDIHLGVEQYKSTEGAVLLDVREADEYRQGHIPGSKNVPLSRIATVKCVAEDLHTPLFVYCLSGGRSRQATALLTSMGYTVVTNIGGIGAYRGKVEKG